MKKLWERRAWLRSIFSSIYFNFKYLPIKQAYKLPIIFYKPKFLSLRGRVIIESNDIKTGMILLGFPKVSIYSNSGIVFENLGGECVFRGRCSIGNDSAISIGMSGNLIFGKRFLATACLKVVSYHSIEFKSDVTVGWENTFIDTDFHALTRLEGGKTLGYGSVVIGKNNWFGLRCTILKNTITPDFCTIGGNSVLNKNYNYPLYTIIAGNPCIKKGHGYFLNRDNDKINYL